MSRGPRRTAKFHRYPVTAAHLARQTAGLSVHIARLDPGPLVAGERRGRVRAVAGRRRAWHRLVLGPRLGPRPGAASAGFAYRSTCRAGENGGMRIAVLGTGVVGRTLAARLDGLG